MRRPEDELDALRKASLHRALRVIDGPIGTHVEIDGQPLVNFSGNDYLGLAQSPELAEAYIAGIQRYGSGAGASRLVCGTSRAHIELEESLAAFLGTEAALSFSTGFATAAGVIGALVQRDDILIIDRLSHACLVDAARASPATLRVFRHNDLDELARQLAWASQRVPSDGRIIVATESVFSMDGDRASLREIVELKDQHAAWLLLDEAHAFGVLGADGRGLAEHEGVADRVELRMGTLGKAAGVAGGFIAASRAVVDLLVNRARSFIYSTAPPPAQAFAAARGIKLIASDEGERRRARLWDNIRQLRAALGLPDGPASAIVPWILGEETAALAVAEQLGKLGILAPAIRYPTVARGTARLRLTLSAAHRADEIARLANALRGNR